MHVLVGSQTKAGGKPVDLWTMRRWRTGVLAVDNSGELPTAHPFDHKLHRLRLPVQLQKNNPNPPAQVRGPHRSDRPVHAHRGQLGYDCERHSGHLYRVSAIGGTLSAMSVE